MEDDRKAVERAVDEFHERLKSGQYQDIYNDAHDIFKRAQKQSASLSAMKQTSDRFGNIEQVGERWISVIIGTPVQIRAIYNTRFTKGETTETFVYIKEGDTVHLAQYQIYPGTVKP